MNKYLLIKRSKNCYIENSDKIDCLYLEDIEYNRKKYFNLKEKISQYKYIIIDEELHNIILLFLFYPELYIYHDYSIYTLDTYVSKLYLTSSLILTVNQSRIFLFLYILLKYNICYNTDNERSFNEKIYCIVKEFSSDYIQEYIDNNIYWFMTDIILNYFTIILTYIDKNQTYYINEYKNKLENMFDLTKFEWKKIYKFSKIKVFINLINQLDQVNNKKYLFINFY